MIDVCLLGTGGMMPLPYRYLTAMMARYNGKSILIDCGEGTQIAMKQKGWSPKPIDVICFTHFHADHISGLPGMLLTMGNAERTEPLLIIGPKGLEKVVGALRMIAPELPFELRFHELSQPFEQIDMGDYRIEAFRVNHNVICYGYNLIVERAGRFQVEKAKALLSHTVEELYGISEPTMDRYNTAKAMDESTKAAAKAKAQAMREASKELDRFHKKAYNYIQARKLVKQLEYYTHWETIFESESAAAEA